MPRLNRSGPKRIHKPAVLLRPIEWLWSEIGERARPIRNHQKLSPGASIWTHPSLQENFYFKYIR